MRRGGDRRMKARLISFAVLAALVAFLAGTATPGAADPDTYDGYSWFDGR